MKRITVSYYNFFQSEYGSTNQEVPLHESRPTRWFILDTTEGNTTTTWTYPPNLTEEPINKRALALPKPVYPPFDQQVRSQWPQNRQPKMHS